MNRKFLIFNRNIIKMKVKINIQGYYCKNRNFPSLKQVYYFQLFNI